MGVFSRNLAFWIWFSTAAPLVSGAATAAPIHPNIILIIADDLGYGDLGCYGSTRIRTPFLDQMARDGLRFTSFYAQSVCGPSRAALMTGSYPIRIGEPGNHKNWHTVPHTREVTLAENLKTIGYATAAIGKWHLCERDPQDPTGWDAGTMPYGQGFDYFYGTPLYNGFSVNVSDYPYRSQVLRNREVVTAAVQSWDNITQDYTREAVGFIRREKEHPFFLYFAHNMPHIPLGASAGFKGRSQAGPFGDAVEEIDWSTGQVLQTLKELGIDDHTLVIFLSDNGPWIEPTVANRPNGKPFIPANHSGTATPLRGYKFVTWDGGSRVPCIVRWPGTIPSGCTTDALTSAMDFLPTFAALAGAKLPDVTLDGRDLGPLMKDPNNAMSPHSELFFYSFTHLQAVRAGRWKLVLPRPEFPRWTLSSGRFVGDGVKETALFDLDTDISETHNVVSDHPNVVSRLMKLIQGARENLGDYDRIGKEARFFDPGAPRPDIDDWKKKSTGASNLD